MVIMEEGVQNEDDIEESCSSQKHVNEDCFDLKIEIKEESIINYNETHECMKNINSSAISSDDNVLNSKERIPYNPKNVHEKTSEIYDENLANLEIHTNNYLGFGNPEITRKDKARINIENPFVNTKVLYDIENLNRNVEEETEEEVDDVFIEGDSDSKNNQNILFRNKNSNSVNSNSNVMHTSPNINCRALISHIVGDKVQQEHVQSVDTINKTNLDRSYDHEIIEIIETAECDVINNEPANLEKKDRSNSMETFCVYLGKSTIKGKTRIIAEDPIINTRVLYDIENLTTNTEEKTDEEADDIFIEGDSDCENNQTTRFRNKNNDSYVVHAFPPTINCRATIAHIAGDKVQQENVESVDTINKANWDRSPDHEIVEIIETAECDVMNDEPAIVEKEYMLKNMETFCIYLRKSAECERKIYRKLLGTSEELLICLKRENLSKIQKSYKDEQFTNSQLRKSCHPMRQFFCKSCPYIAKRRLDLCIHILETHKKLAAELNIPPVQNMCAGQEPHRIWYKCTDCAFISKYKNTFFKHLLIHKQLHEVETFSCASCPYITKIKQNLINHMENHKEKKDVIIHRCPYCNFSTQHKPYMKNHIKYLHKKDEIPSFSCNKCPFKTVYKSTLQSHLLTHSEKRKLYKCTLCPFQTPQKAVLRNTHHLVHKSDEEMRIYHCAHCSFKGKSRQIIVRHLLIHKSSDALVMFKCDKCSYQTRHRGCFRRHLQIHQDAKKLVSCSLCSYQGKRKDHLRTHMRLRHQDPNEGTFYKCGMCTYQSRNSSHLKRHRRIHMKPEDIIFHHCSSCDYKAKSKSELKQHFKRIHEKPPKEVKWYKCEECGLKFNQTKVLRWHMARHEKSEKKTPTEPMKLNMFYCYHCSYHTKSKADLARHVPMHANFFLSCDKCDFQTRYQTCMLRHSKTQH